MDDASATSPPLAPQHRGRRGALIVLSALLLALLALAGAFGLDALRLKESSAELMSSAPAAQSALASGDTAALESAVGDLTRSAVEFSSATDGPHWWLASHTPWVRDQVRPLIAAGVAVDSIANDALAPLVAVGGLEVLENPPVVDGRLDPGMLSTFREPLAHASEALASQQAALAEVDLTGTVDAVSSRFVELEGQLSDLSEMVDGASTVAELLPTMLGGDGPRTYAVILQNNAEPRTSGGIPGAVMLVTVDDGALTLGDYYSASDLLDGHPIEVATQEEIALFGEEISVYPQDATFTPQFPRTAALMAAFVERATGVAPDGVVSLDPIALGYMLGDSSARDIGGIEVDGSNLAAVMLSAAYVEFGDPEAQDAFFAQAASVLFGDILSAGPSTVDGLRRALEERRFAAWSADAREQALLESTDAGGDLLGDDVWAGVFLNDASGTKMGYYVDLSVAVSACAVEVTISHTFEGNVQSLPDYVAEGVGLAPRGVFAGTLTVFPPVGADVDGVAVDGQSSLFGTGVLAGRQAVELGVSLEPGQSMTVTVSLEGATAPAGPQAVAVTPGARTPVIELRPDGC